MSIPSPDPTPARTAIWWLAVPALLLAVPALGLGLVVIEESVHSDADFAGLGILLGLVLGAPGAVAIVLALIGVALRRRNPGAALALAIAALAVVGLLALLLVPVVIV